jgi:hypothetical protein
LFGARDKSENQLSGHVPPQQPLRVGEISRAASWGSIGLGLRQIQITLPLQRLPHRPPIQRCGLHHRFWHAPFGQPDRQLAQLAFGRAKLPSLELELTHGGRVGDDHSQHALMNVDSHYFICCFHGSSVLDGAPAEHALNWLSTVTYYRRCRNDSEAYTHLFKCMLWIRQRTGLNSPTAPTTSAGRASW